MKNELALCTYTNISTYVYDMVNNDSSRACVVRLPQSSTSQTPTDLSHIVFGLQVRRCIHRTYTQPYTYCTLCAHNHTPSVHTDIPQSHCTQSAGEMLCTVQTQPQRIEKVKSFKVVT